MTTACETSHKFTTKLTHKGKGIFPALKGIILEGDSQVGTFSRGAVRDNFVPPIQYKFSSERALNRLADVADCLTLEEITEALTV